MVEACASTLGIISAAFAIVSKTCVGDARELCGTVVEVSIVTRVASIADCRTEVLCAGSGAFTVA